MTSKPDFLCIGPAKTGTTWIYNNITKHSLIKMPPIKEIRFFWEKEYLENKSINLFRILSDKHWHFKSRKARLLNTHKRYAYKLLNNEFTLNEMLWDFKYYFLPHNSYNWYRSLFPKKFISGDITPNYCELSERSIKNIANEFPHLKIIIGLREPIERDWSRAKMVVLKKKNKRYSDVNAGEFISYFENNKRQFLANNYADLVQRWSNHFPKNQILYYFFDDLTSNPAVLLKNIYKFLDLEPEFQDEAVNIHRKGLKIDIPKTIYKYLKKENLDNYKSNNIFLSSYTQNWYSKHYE